MASTPDQSANPNRPRLRNSQGEFPALPAPRLPPLRHIEMPYDRTREQHRELPLGPQLLMNRPQTRAWSAAARRAQRIRNFEDQPSSLDASDRAASQPRWVASSRRHDRPRSADHRRHNFNELDQTLDEANSQLRSLLDMTNHINLMTPLMRNTFSPTLRPHNTLDGPRRSKRRKLDADRLVSNFKGFRYGKFGQVEPGQLQMEIVSCDGGMFSSQSSYAAENILKNDNSVYCTKGNRCNIVLSHRGATVFTLRELVIKAPGSMNFSHPVREGMVFITMNQDDVLSRTAQYYMQYGPVARTRPCAGPHDAWQTSADRDTRHIISIRHHDDGTTSTRARRSFVYRGNNDDDGDDYDDYSSSNDEVAPHRTMQLPPEFVHNLPDFCITTECSDDEDDIDLSQLFRRAPNRIGSLPFETPDSDSEEANPFGSAELVVETARQDLRPRHRRSQDRREQVNLSLAEAWDAHANATQEAVRAVGGELLAPHARFLIENKKSKCTIRFDPPVSGRFLLLKMWSSQHDSMGNVDIQSIIARGFAGPRYFPSIAMK